MRQAIPIFKKEFRSYFVSPIAYIVISIFLLVTGWFFFATFFLVGQANLRNFFSLLPLIFSFVIPALTMRLVSEELNLGSYELLLTLPVTLTDVVIGKFMAAVAFVIAMLVPTLMYPVTVANLVFASAMTRNQIIAFIVGMAICFILTLIDKMLFFLPRSMLGVLTYLGADFHFQNISKGIIDSRDIIYFLSVCFAGLYAAHMALKEKN